MVTETSPHPTRARRTQARSVHAAWVDASACVHPTAALAPGVVVHAGASVGPRCELRAGSVVGAAAWSSARALFSACTRPLSTAGLARTVFFTAASASDGFGFAIEADGTVRKKPLLADGESATSCTTQVTGH